MNGEEAKHLTRQALKNIAERAELKLPEELQRITFKIREETSEGKYSCFYAFIDPAVKALAMEELRARGFAVRERYDLAIDIYWSGEEGR